MAGTRGACVSVRSLYNRWAKKTLKCERGGVKAVLVKGNRGAWGCLTCPHRPACQGEGCLTRFLDPASKGYPTGYPAHPSELLVPLKTHLRLSPAHPGMLNIIASTCSLHLHVHAGVASPLVARESALNKSFPPKRPSRRRRGTAQGALTLTRGLAHAHSKILAAVSLGKPVTRAT